MAIRAHILVAGDAVLAQGTLLCHSEGAARPLGSPMAARKPFARVLDSTAGEKAADGSYRVRCELILTSTYRGGNAA